MGGGGGCGGAWGRGDGGGAEGGACTTKYSGSEGSRLIERWKRAGTTARARPVTASCAAAAASASSRVPSSMATCHTPGSSGAQPDAVSEKCERASHAAESQPHRGVSASRAAASYAPRAGSGVASRRT